MSLILKSIVKADDSKFDVVLEFGGITVEARFMLEKISDAVQSLSVEDDCVGKLLTLVGAAGALNKRIFSYGVSGFSGPVALSGKDGGVISDIWNDLRAGVTLDAVWKKYADVM